MKKTIAWLSLLVLLQVSTSWAQQPVVSLDTEHGVVMRLIQELDALKALAEEGNAVQRQGNDLVLIDFDELTDVFEMIRSELRQSLQRKYGNADISEKPGLF